VAAAADDDIVTFSEDIDAGNADEDPAVYANLDVDDDAPDGFDDVDEAEQNQQHQQGPTKMKRGVHLDYMRSVRDRLRTEVTSKTKALEKSWLTKYLQDNDGWIRKEQAKNIIQKLNSSKVSPSTYATADVKWRPQNALG
jgi:hypothetical protein